MELEKQLMKGVLRIKNKRIRVNEKIRSDEVRLISETGEQLGVMELDDAIKRKPIRSAILCIFTRRPPHTLNLRLAAFSCPLS